VSNQKFTIKGDLSAVLKKKDNLRTNEPKKIGNTPAPEKSLKESDSTKLVLRSTKKGGLKVRAGVTGHKEKWGRLRRSDEPRDRDRGSIGEASIATVGKRRRKEMEAREKYRD